MLGSSHIGIWMGRRAEKEIIATCEKHLEKIFSIVNKFKTFIDVVCDGDVDGAKKLALEITELEREADEIKEAIIEDLMGSTLHPMDQDEIIQLVLSSDDIATELKAAARKINFSHITEIPENIEIGLKQMVVTLIEETAALIATIESLVNNRSDVVENAELKIDDIRVDLLAKILDWGDAGAHVRDFIMMKEAVENIELSSDKVEDTADLIRAIAILRGRRR
jgi:predicted phosphate transport protein (TIGR00153 family)